MTYRREWYLGYEIKAYVKPADGGFVAAATVMRVSPSSKEFEVEPPPRLHRTASAAEAEGVAWARDLIDELTRDLVQNHRR